MTNETSNQLYYVFTHGADGTSMSEHTKEDLEEKLADRYWGEVYPKQVHPGPDNPDRWTSAGEECVMLIVKGTVVVPRAAKVVTKYVLP